MLDLSSPERRPTPTVRFVTGPAEWAAILVSLIVVGVVYLRTVAPTVTFWDSGEFIACSYILGIPHPPGTPFFILLGRAMTILLPFGEIAWRVNMLSAGSSVLAAVFASMVVYRIVLPWTKDLGDAAARWIPSASAVVAAFLLAFGATFWANGTEAEVYGTSLLFMMVVTWLAVVWYEARGAARADRLLVIILYITFLGVGVHMQNLMMCGPIFLMVALADRKKIQDPFLWGVALLVTMALWHTTGFLAGIMASLVLVPLCLLVGLSPRWKARVVLATALLGVTAVGYSPHIYIPLRSLQEPAIDENDPETWETYKGFLERKQYGSESMLTRAMSRRGSWQSQLVDDKNMGLWINFRDQFTENDAARAIFIFTGLAGLALLLLRSPPQGSLIGLACAIGSIGLVLYLNFSDGTLGDKAEVRNRDYFFTPGFAYFALLVGIGLGGLLEMIHRWIRENAWAAGIPVAAVGLPYVLPHVPVGTFPGGPTISSLGAMLVLFVVGGGAAHLLASSRRPAVMTLGSALAMVLMAFHQPISAHYTEIDRHLNRIANDYGRNILASCEPNGLLFTNGDNDTFPLWYHQEVEGFRRDVRVLNLSLLNTDWYIKQLRDREPKVPINLTDDQIENIPAYQFTQARKLVRKQDRMIQQIVRNNAWERPVYFAITVPESNRLGLDKNLALEGFVYRLNPEPVEYKVEPVRTWELVRNEYRYSGLKDDRVYKDANTRNLLNNYVAILHQLASHHRKNGDPAMAARILEYGLDRVPSLRWEVDAFVVQTYQEAKDAEGTARSLEELLSLHEGNPDAMNYAASVYEQAGDVESAVAVYRRGLALGPDSDVLYQGLFGTYYRAQQTELATEVLEEWMVRRPTSERARQLHDQWSSAFGGGN